MMNRVLRRTQFGNPVLREETRSLNPDGIKSAETQQLIADLFYTLKKKRYGVGLAATQVGKSISLAVVDIKPTKLRPDLPKSKWAKLVLINPTISKTYGNKRQLWEGCISLSDVFARVPRYKKIQVSYLDEKGIKRIRDFENLTAHVIQHEIDHLNGILFVDKVKDPSTYMSLAEYKKRIVSKRKK